MEYARVPSKYLKCDCLAPEEEYHEQSLKCNVRKFTPEDIARLNAQLEAKRPSVTVDICGELNVRRKGEKKPERQFEIVRNKPRSEWLMHRSGGEEVKEVNKESLLRYLRAQISDLRQKAGEINAQIHVLQDLECRVEVDAFGAKEEAK